MIVGGGFAGLYAAKTLRKKAVDVTLIDRRNFHLFQPLLYQVATGALSPANIASPLRKILHGQQNTRVIMDEVIDFDLDKKLLIMREGEVEYDSLILAPGSVQFYFGHHEWEGLAPSLKTIEDATEIRHRLLAAFEHAEREKNPERLKAWLTFVIVGAGPTGVELAGAVAEIARDTLTSDFRNIVPSDARIMLIDSNPRVLPPFSEESSAEAEKALLERGVIVLKNRMVTDIQPGTVRIKSDAGEEQIDAQTVLWAAGVKASPLGALLREKGGVELDRGGRVLVESNLTIPGHPDIFVVGDLAHLKDEEGNPLPGLAPVAMQQGRYAAEAIVARLNNESLEPFRYFDRGSMATIGRKDAVADIGKLHLSGFPAWLIWLFVHLMYIVEYENRVLVLLQWAWNYVTRNRSARLITGEGQRQPTKASSNEAAAPKSSTTPE